MEMSTLKKFRKDLLVSQEPKELIDLKTVSIDPTLAPGERLDSFIHQVKNPYAFKVGDLSVAVKYAGHKTLDASLLSLLNTSG